MLRISALIAILMLIGTTANVSAAEPQTKSGTKACTLVSCVEACQKGGNAYGVGKSCDRYCQQRMATGACS